VSAGPALAPDAAIVLGIASTALPFASTPEDAAERWLRVLRLHGEAGAALQALGVSEGPLRRSAETEYESAPTVSADEREALAQVLENAIRRADRRGAAGVATSDVLMGVMDVYGADFERVLRAHGTDRNEVIEQLGAASARRGMGTARHR
jgi:ATP-dependent Clp protease ATP-binding subunit ClpA